LQLPLSAIAGVQGDEAEEFEEYKDGQAKVVPLSTCWLPSGDILVGCRGGQLLKVNIY
jgi:hypothetical protein